MKTLILDLGGVVYSLSPNYDKKEEDEIFKDGLSKIENIKEYKGVLDEYIQYGANQKILKAENYLIMNKIIPVYPLTDAVYKLNNYSLEYNIIVVSTSLVETSIEICKIVGMKNIPKMIYNILDYGSKKDSESWKPIFTMFKNIDIIVEDSERNLIAAAIAAKELGYNPKLVQSVLEI